ncbi:hypothetical protein [Streptomyces sp. CB03238]|uniref:hypothetical protein n=1 Tax=Streptomyces sp. CB03238 TaxID=1907777 RepID=UPI000A1058E3|nr:hypothetical protein [Streptomyces sp. CB03238]ORT61675.1 hypothetical protein BKD26_01175 [Streptomyces sp. CB03238]
MVSRRSFVQAGGLSAAVWALSGPQQLAWAGTSEPPPPGDHIPATELGDTAACTVPADHDPEVIRIVYRVGGELGVNDKVMLAGFEAGWVESHMNNLSCGHLDSVGVFQQRPSQGWGTREQCMDVTYAANAFFVRAVETDRAHPEWTAGQVAQGVQRSAFPERYDQAEAKARALIDEAARMGPLPGLPGVVRSGP